MNLYQISKEYRLIEQQLIDSEGEITEDLEIALQINQENRDNAFRNIFGLLQEKEDELAALKSRIETLQELQKARTKSIESYKKILVRGIEDFGAQTIDGVKISIRKSENTDAEVMNEMLEKISSELSNRFEKKFCDLDNDDISILSETTNYSEELIKKLKKYEADGMLTEKLTINMKPDKKTIKIGLKAGSEIYGCAIISNNNLAIK